MLRKLLRNKKTTSTLSVLALVMAAAVSAWAFGGGTSTAGQTLYDFVVVDLLGGPIGAMAGIIALAFGAYQIIGRSQFAMGVPAIIGGAIIVNADALATSFGALVG